MDVDSVSVFCCLIIFNSEDVYIDEKDLNVFIDVVYFNVLSVLDNWDIGIIFILLMVCLGVLVLGIIVCLKLCFVVLIICLLLLGIGLIFFVRFILLNIIKFFGNGWFWKFDIIVNSKVKFVLVLVIFMLLMMLIKIFWLFICILLCLCSMVSNIERWFWFSFIVIWWGLDICE